MYPGTNCGASSKARQSSRAKRAQFKDQTSISAAVNCRSGQPQWSSQRQTALIDGGTGGIVNSASAGCVGGNNSARAAAMRSIVQTNTSWRQWQSGQNM